MSMTAKDRDRPGTRSLWLRRIILVGGGSVSQTALKDKKISSCDVGDPPSNPPFETNFELRVAGLGVRHDLRPLTRSTLRVFWLAAPVGGQLARLTPRPTVYSKRKRSTAISGEQDAPVASSAQPCATAQDPARGARHRAEGGAETPFWEQGATVCVYAARRNGKMLGLQTRAGA